MPDITDDIAINSMLLSDSVETIVLDKLTQGRILAESLEGNRGASLIIHFISVLRRRYPKINCVCCGKSCLPDRLLFNVIIGEDINHHLTKYQTPPIAVSRYLCTACGNGDIMEAIDKVFDKVFGDKLDKTPNIYHSPGHA